MSDGMPEGYVKLTPDEAVALIEREWDWIKGVADRAFWERWGRAPSDLYVMPVGKIEDPKRTPK